MDLDELERLRAAAEQQLGSRELGSTYLYETDVDAYMTALRNSAEELIRDARRYRWLRTIARQACHWDVHGNGAHWTTGFHTKDGRLDFAAALDAAIAQEGKGLRL